MNHARRIFAFYINSSIHLGFVVVALLAITIFEFNLQVPKSLWPFVFLGTVTGYNFVKYAKIAGLHHRSLTDSLRTIQIFSFLCFVVLCFVALHLSFKTLAVTAGLALLTFFYAVPLLNNKNLRTLPALKIFIVAVVWAGISVLVPVFASDEPLDLDIWLTFFQRLLIVIVLTLPFEIRDIPYDSFALKTFPQQLGVRNTKLMGILFLVISVALEFFKTLSAKPYLIGLVVFCLLLGAMLVISKTHQKRYFASFWVEGLPLVWFVILWLFQNFGLS